MSNSKFIIFVHGIWDTPLLFAPVRRFFEGAGYVTLAIDLKPKNGEAPLEDLARQLKDFVKIHLKSDQKFDLVGFSMGGLVSRYYVQKLGGNKRVCNLVFISTPHHGSIWAYSWNFFGKRPGVKQMRPASPFLKSLNRHPEELKQVRCLSIWTIFDLMIVPSWSSILSNGASGGRSKSANGRLRGKSVQNKITFTLLHPLMVLSKKVWRIILEFLEEKA